MTALFMNNSNMENLQESLNDISHSLKNNKSIEDIIDDGSFYTENIKEMTEDIDKAINVFKYNGYSEDLNSLKNIHIMNLKKFRDSIESYDKSINNLSSSKNLKDFKVKTNEFALSIKSFGTTESSIMKKFKDICDYDFSENN